MKKNQLKIKEKQPKLVCKKEELIEEEIIERINTQIQISTIDNLNYQREDNGNLIHIASLTHKSSSKSEVSSISKGTSNNNNVTNCKENNDSFIQKMSVNGLEFNLKSIRSVYKTNNNDQKDNCTNNNTQNEQYVFKNTQIPSIYFGKKKLINPVKPIKADDSQLNVNVSKDALNISKNQTSIKINNIDVKIQKNSCDCSVKLRVMLFALVLIALIAFVLVGVYLKR